METRARVLQVLSLPVIALSACTTGQGLNVPPDSTGGPTTITVPTLTLPVYVHRLAANDGAVQSEGPSHLARASVIWQDQCEIQFSVLSVPRVDTIRGTNPFSPQGIPRLMGEQFVAQGPNQAQGQYFQNFDSLRRRQGRQHDNKFRELSLGGDFFYTKVVLSNGDGLGLTRDLGVTLNDRRDPDHIITNITVLIPSYSFSTDSMTFRLGAHELGHQLNLEERQSPPQLQYKWLMEGSIPFAGDSLEGAIDANSPSGPPAQSECFIARQWGKSEHLFQQH